MLKYHVQIKSVAIHCLFDVDLKTQHGGSGLKRKKKRKLPQKRKCLKPEAVSMLHISVTL